MSCSKKGVSLITVLLFMLVATIAATATFKWLTSENRSSASRMQKQEAYQTSLAGIEDARAWMSNHANEVGAIVKQFFDSEKPILLNPVLHNLNRNGQSNSIWLTAVDTSNANAYKLKLLSKGTSRNGAVHTEAAILNVSGLYRVKVPQESMNITFNKAFHGGSEGITGDDAIGSGNINGNWTYSNNPKIKGDMIVTGFAEYGSAMNHYGDFYLAGNLENKAGSTTYGSEPPYDTVVVYIGGNVTCANGQHITVYGDLYVKGDISKDCKVYVSRNFTFGGHILRENDFNVDVGWNWVFTNQNSYPEEQLELTHYVNNNTKFSIGKNLYFPYKIKAHCSEGNNCGDSEGKRGFVVGGDVYQYASSPFVIETQQDHKVYDFGDTPMAYGVYMDGYTRPFDSYGRDFCSDDRKNCKRGRIFSFNANNIHTHQRISSWSPTDNVLRSVPGSSDWNYWSKIDKLNRYGRMIKPTAGTGPGQIPQPILTKNEADWKRAKANSVCGLGDYFDFTDDVIKKLNSCYLNKKSSLYNGFLIIEWNDPFGIEGDVSEILDGKFVIYAPEVVGQTKMPPTTSGSIVMLYLEKGTKVTVGDGGVINVADGQLQGRKGFEYNYFIFSKGDIGEINNLHIKGSVVMANGKKLLKYQGGCNLEYNGDVLTALLTAGIIKENPEYTSLVTGEEVGEDDIIAGATQYDSYFIATSPQLGILMESQYESKEKVEESGDNAAESIAPSAIILPRVIYLTKDPVGKLSDYYSVVYLNGPSESGSTNVTCDPALNTTTKLYENGNQLTKGIYSCKYNSSTYGNLPFYVVVNGESGTIPTVSLDATPKEITNNGSVTVSAVIGASTRLEPIKVDISVSKAPDGWTITPSSGVTMTLRSSSNVEDVYTLTLQPNVSEIELFTVTTNAAARQGSVYFHLMTPMEGCAIGSPSSERIIMTGYVTVQRGSISQYCSKTENQTICLEKPFNEIVRAPDCDSLVSGEWIRALGTNVTVIDENNKWNVGVNTAISLKGQSSIPSYCELVLPTENNTITNTVENGEYMLYASLKRKQYTLTVKSKDIGNDGTHVNVFVKSGDEEYREVSSDNDICKRNSDDDLVCYVYAGWNVKTNYALDGGDKFSRWECEGFNCPVPAANGLDFVIPQITASNTITAVFNDKDNHCFYEDFTDLTAFCAVGNDTKCIKTCEGGNGSSCTVSGSNAEWQLMYPNNGNGANIAPIIQNGYIKSGSDKLNDNSTIILSTKEAGIHGIMTTLIQTAVLENNTKHLNSGFIFSSDATASSFTLLNIYGTASNGKALTARVCQGSANGNSIRSDNCSSTTFKTASSTTIAMSSESMVKLNIELTLSNKLEITATVDGKIASAELDISTYLGSRDEHARYVGFNISDPSFKIYDIGWSSFYFIEECFENPKINCSFAANYIGGVVPKGKDVTPWVGVSSWYEEHGCTVSYYYNGCDNATGSAPSGCNGHSNKEWFKNWRSEYDINGNYFGALLEDSTYNFSEDGAHGNVQEYSYNLIGGKKITVNRAIDDAKVKISCANHQTSLDGTWSSCGAFWVGEITSCSQNAQILKSTSAQYANADQELEIPVNDNDGIVNLRGSTLWLNISEFAETENDKINLYLKDENGILSLPREINSNGNQSFDVNDMSNVESFNPQAVKSVVLKSSLYPYQVNSIMSSCPNALGIRNCTATYNGISWSLNSTITNIEGAAANGCSVIEGSSKKLENVSCPSDGKFTFRDDEDLYNQVNSTGNAVERTFEIIATSNDGGEVSCLTETVTISPIEVTCSIDKTVVETGEGMPSLTFSFAGCPSSGCEYTAKVESKESVTGTVSADGFWTPTVNNLPALPTGEYTYYVSVFGGESKECGTVTVANASAAEVTNCRLEKDDLIELEKKDLVLEKEIPGHENYVFTADVVPATDGSEWKIQIVIFDPLGKEVKKEPKNPKKGKGEHFDQPIPGKDIASGYSAQLYLNGVAVPGCHLPFDKNAPSSSSTAMSSAEEDVSSSSADLNSSASNPKVVCPGTFANQYPDDEIDVSGAKIRDCPDGDCRIDILYGSETKNSNNELTFYDLNATGKRTYTLKATSNGKSHQCTFDVHFVSRIEVACPADVENQDPTKKVSVTNASVHNCNPCTYKVMDSYGEEKGSSDRINFAFDAPGPGTTGTRNYKFVASDNKGHFGDCTFKVTYEPPIELKCPDDVKNQNPTDPIPLNGATVEYCSSCNFQILDGASVKTEGYDIGGLSFTDANASGERKYTLMVTDPSASDRSKSCTFKVKFASTASGDVTNTGPINCDFSSFEISLGESFNMSPNYNGSCYNSTFTGNGVDNPWNCSGSYTVTPTAVGKHKYEFRVTSGGNGSASCSADIVVNDVDVSGSVTIAYRNTDVTVPCRYTVEVTNLMTQQYSETWLHCTGNFKKTVGGNTVDQYNEARVKVCDGHDNSERSCTGIFTTDCLPGLSMTCNVRGP